MLRVCYECYGFSGHLSLFPYTRSKKKVTQTARTPVTVVTDCHLFTWKVRVETAYITIQKGQPAVWFALVPAGPLIGTTAALR
jgi:hypothetical protein